MTSREAFRILNDDRHIEAIVKAGHCVGFSSEEEAQKAVKNSLYMALDALRTQADAKYPLTLDELREMDGEPVFIRNTEYCDCWALVQVANKIMFTLNNGAMVPAELEFKCGGKAYRRKPEEEEKHGRMD